MPTALACTKGYPLCTCPAVTTHRKLLDWRRLPSSATMDCARLQPAGCPGRQFCV